MKIWRIVTGIISILLSILVAFDACLESFFGAIFKNREIDASAGFWVALFLLAGGIVSLIAQGSETKIGHIILILLFGAGAYFGFANYVSYPDLALWAFWCVANAAVAGVALLVSPKKGEDPSDEA